MRGWQWLQAHRLLLWTGAAVLILAVYAVAVWAAPRLLGVPELTGTPDAAAVLTARHNARLLVISLAGALVVAIGLLYTARRPGGRGRAHQVQVVQVDATAGRDHRLGR